MTDRSYIGEIKFRGQWLEGKHEPIIDLATFDRVQVLLGNKSHHRHRSVYGGGLIACGHCGRPVLCEVKFKKYRECGYCGVFNRAHRGGQDTAEVFHILTSLLCRRRSFRECGLAFVLTRRAAFSTHSRQTAFRAH